MRPIPPRDANSPISLDWWRERKCSFEVIAICQEDAIGDFDGKTNDQRKIHLVAKLNTRLSRAKVEIELCLGNDAEFETMTELTGRLKKDRQFALLLEFGKLNGTDKDKTWHFGHALVDNVKLRIETMTSPL